MSDTTAEPLSEVLKRAAEPTSIQGHEALKPGHVAFAPLHVRNTSSDNIKRIAEFVTKLTWREAVTIADAVEREYKRVGSAIDGDARFKTEVDNPDLAEAFVVWAEKLLGEAS